MRTALPVLVLFACVQVPAPAQQNVRARGSATVSVAPDQAIVEIGVVTQAATAEAAAAANAKQLQKVLAELRRVSGPAAQIKTTSYWLQPDYRQPEPRQTGSPSISGYTATNVVEVTTPDLPGVGKLIDAALGAGANKIRGLRFMLKDDREVRSKALTAAAREARADAEAIASALGLRIRRVVSAEEAGSEARPYPQPRVMAMAEARAPTAVEPGTVDVDAEVILTVEVDQ